MALSQWLALPPCYQPSPEVEEVACALALADGCARELWRAYVPMAIAAITTAKAHFCHEARTA